MSGSDAKFLRRFFLWAGVKDPGEQRKRREAFERMSHKERGRARAEMQRAMDDDPGSLPPLKRPPAGLDEDLDRRWQEYIENLAVGK